MCTNGINITRNTKIKFDELSPDKQPKRGKAPITYFSPEKQKTT